MGRIKVLDSQIYNRIAAGEVIERPASVVKELVENSIDAGANNLVVEISGGGLRSIKVTDNGCGIIYEDLETAFLPHATSKINEASDLFSISTLGFRGEALASIAAVAMVNVKSKVYESESGGELEIKGGQIINKSPCSLSCGTVISVENLFFNTPARLKFMKKPKYEEGEIKSLIANIILANPNVAIQLIADGEIVMQSSGNGLYEAIQAVYDKGIIDNLVPIFYNKGGYRINGYIGKRTLSKSNRSYQTIIINGRVINNQLISTAVSKAYGDSMMTRCYPVFILDIIMPFDSVDVNVHPAKSEVRFKENNTIFAIIASAVSKALNEQNTMPEVNTDIYNDSVEDSISSNKEEKHSEDNEEQISYLSSINNIRPASEKNNIIDIISSSSGKIKESSSISADIINRIINNPKPAPISQQEKISIKTDFNIIGQLFNTYILLHYNQDVLIVDQHAALERINYDKLINSIKDNNYSQPLLIPYIFSVNHYESEFIHSNLDKFNSIGIEIEAFGNNSFKIGSVPSVLCDMDYDLFIKNSIKELINLNNLKLEEIMRDKLAQIACKASIKGNRKLNNEEISMLMDIITDGKIPLQCPHGRPAIIRLTRDEVDKWFKRIV